MRKKLITAIIALSLTLCCVVGVTLAYLVDSTGTIINTFNPQNIDVELKETTGTEYDMVPGITLKKDPTVTIVNDIDCYVFVMITEANNVWNNGTKDITIIEWVKADGWTLVDGTTNVYYREVLAEATDKTFSVLADDQVKVSTDVTKVYMDGIENNTIAKPTLSFIAYATQMYNDTTKFTPAQAWANCKG